jgi:hypothetical protein
VFTSLDPVSGSIGTDDARWPVVEPLCLPMQRTPVPLFRDSTSPTTPTPSARTRPSTFRDIFSADVGEKTVLGAKAIQATAGGLGSAGASLGSAFQASQEVSEAAEETAGETTQSGDSYKTPSKTPTTAASERIRRVVPEHRGFSSFGPEINVNEEDEEDPGLPRRDDVVGRFNRIKESFSRRKGARR